MVTRQRVWVGVVGFSRVRIKWVGVGVGIRELEFGGG